MSTVHLKNVRAAFTQALFEAKQVNGEGTPAFSSAFIMGPDHPGIKELKKAMEEVGKAKWGDKWPAVKKAMEAQDRTALHDGDTKADYDGYAGNYFVNARSKTRPTVVNRDRSPITEQDGIIYSGCYVNAIVELWAQDNSYGKRINASLKGVQFLKDGDAFSSGGAASADEFDDLGDQGDDDDLIG